jgi:hypothetical protein
MADNTAEPPMELDLGGIVAHVDGDRLIVDRADEEVTLGFNVVEGLLHGAFGPYFVVEVLPYRTRVSFGTFGAGVGRVTYQLGPRPEPKAMIGPVSDLCIRDAIQPTVTLKRID